MPGYGYNGYKWLELARNGGKLPEMAGMAGNGWKWLKMSRNGWKWLECLEIDGMAENS